MDPKIQTDKTFNLIGFLQFIRRFENLTIEAEMGLLECLTERTFKKGQCIVRAGDICDKLFFIEEGLAKTSFHRNDKEFIMRFFSEGSMFTLLDSYSQKLPSTYSIIAIEPTRIIWISRSHWDTLSKQWHEMDRFFAKLACVAATNMMKRISEMLEENATVSYHHFLAENGALLQRISLGDLANYLGITQVSLSRVRGRK